MKNNSLQSYTVQHLTKIELKTMNQTLKSPLRMLSLVVVHCAQRDTVIVETSGIEGNPTLAQ